MGPHFGVRDDDNADNIMGPHFGVHDDDIMFPIIVPSSTSSSSLRSSSSSSSASSSSSDIPAVVAPEGPLFVRLSTRATRKTTSIADLVECWCGCGLMTDGVEGCPKCRLGRIRDECLAAYRRCRNCPRQLFSKTLTESVYDRKEVVVPSTTDLVTRRCQEPSTRDQTEFRIKVLNILPPLLRGKAFSKCVHILRTYGTEEEKARMMVSSPTLLEHTLSDATVAVNPYIHLADLRGLRFTSTPNNLVLRWWINDRVIDHYLSLVNIKAMELGLRSCCYSTGFLDKFRMEGYGEVKRWSTKKDLKSRTAFDFERLLIPINHNNTHWTFMVAHIRQKRILYYDSNAASTRQSTGTRDMQLLHR